MLSEPACVALHRGSGGSRTSTQAHKSRLVWLGMHLQTTRVSQGGWRQLGSRGAGRWHPGSSPPLLRLHDAGRRSGACGLGSQDPLVVLWHA